MARIRCLSVPLGTHHSPDGPITVDAKRVARWVRQHEQLYADGIRLPLSWGHVGKSQPMTEDEYQEALGKHVAGYVTRMHADPRGLVIEADVPGAEMDDDGNLITWLKLPDGSMVKSAIRETSAAIHKWRDGRGRVHDDIPVHISLTPLPVCPNPAGFEKLSTLRARSRADDGRVYLSTTTLEKQPMPLNLANDYERSKWKAHHRVILRQLVRKGLDPNVASGCWSAICEHAELRRLSTIHGYDAVKSRIDVQISAWSFEYAGQPERHALPLTRSERAVVHRLSTTVRPAKVTTFRLSTEQAEVVTRLSTVRRPATLTNAEKAPIDEMSDTEILNRLVTK